MITEFKTIPKAVYYVQTADGCTVLDPDGDTLAEITSPGGYFPGIADADGGPGTVTFSAPVKRVVGPFDLAPQLLLNLLGQLGGNGGLPAGFKRVEWLESDGGQYILTGVHLTSDAQFDMTSQQLKFRLTPTDFQIGARCASANTLFVGPSHANDSWQVVGGINGNYYFKKPPYSNTEKVSIFLNGKQAKINGEIVNAADKYTFSTDNYNSSAITEAVLFGVTRAIPNDVLICSSCRIWYAEIWSDLNKKTERKFVPCLNTLTGEPCMFDLVTRKPFYNSGSGDFTSPTESTTYALRRVLPDWGKLTENGLRRLYHAPASYRGELIDYALENGYKPIVEPEKPETGYWYPRWTETEEEIVLEWVETEPPTVEHLTQPTV